MSGRWHVALLLIFVFKTRVVRIPRAQPFFRRPILCFCFCPVWSGLLSTVRFPAPFCARDVGAWCERLARYDDVFLCSCAWRFARSTSLFNACSICAACLSYTRCAGKHRVRHGSFTQKIIALRPAQGCVPSADPYDRIQKLWKPILACIPMHFAFPSDCCATGASRLRFRLPAPLLCTATRVCPCLCACSLRWVHQTWARAPSCARCLPVLQR